MSVEDLRAIALFDGLSDDQLRELMAVGEQLRFKPGEELFREAQPADYWWVLLDGSIRLVRQVGHEETVLTTMDSPGQWAGGFRAWDAHSVYLATGRGAAPGRVLRVPAELLRDRANAWFPFGVHLIRGLFSTVRTIESVARQREALVALGTLAASGQMTPGAAKPVVCLSQSRLIQVCIGNSTSGIMRLKGLRRPTSLTKDCRYWILYCTTNP